jgi:exodeoxyribonuclease VII small subunit
MSDPIDYSTLSFEEALAMLEDLLGRMESGRQPLETLISDFEAGSKLLAVCRSKLAGMERRIEVLVKDDGGQGEWQDFGGVETPRTQL